MGKDLLTLNSGDYMTYLHWLESLIIVSDFTVSWFTRSVILDVAKNNNTIMHQYLG